MKFFKLLSLMAFVAASLFVSSCSDDDKDNPITPTNSNYFVMTNGSSWISDFYQKNMGNQTVTSTLIVDTTKVSGTDVFLGKTANKMVISSSNGGSKSYLQYFENNILYSELNFIMPSDLSFLPSNMIPENQWVPLVKSNETTWEVFSKDLPSMPLEVAGVPGVTLTSKLTITGTKGATGTMTIDSKTINTQTFNYTFGIAGTAAAVYSGLPIAIPVNFVLNLRLTYGENVGLVKQEMDSQKLAVSVPMLGSKDIKDVEGFVNTCRLFSIK